MVIPNMLDEDQSNMRWGYALVVKLVDGVKSLTVFIMVVH